MKTVKQLYKEVERMVGDELLNEPDGDMDIDAYHAEIEKRGLIEVDIWDEEAAKVIKFLKKRGIPSSEYYCHAESETLALRK